MMNKTPTVPIISTLKRASVLLLIFFFAAGLCYHFTASPQPQGIDPAIAQSSSDFKHIGGNWWESNRLIYHGIPARIVFLLPQVTDIYPDKVNKSVWQEFDRIGKIFNPFDPNSEIYHLNSISRSKPIIVSGDVYSVIDISKQLWINTDRHFDPTMWPIKQLWQSAEKNQLIPAEADIINALQKTGFDKIRITGKIKHSIEFNSQPMTFDFGGVVKGYAVDKVRQILSGFGITAGLVQLGGEICAFGDNNNKPWRFGIQHPKQMDKLWGVLSSIGDLRVSTSGNYRQPIKINGQSFYHIFSPKTGKPVSDKILGVTTACLDGKTTNAQLDGITTAITVMGTAKGLQLAEKLNVEAVIIYEIGDGKIDEAITHGLKGYYKKQDNLHR